jgi:shikimate kinase
VLATGGGAACSESAWEALEESADVVWLDASIDVLLARTGTASGRPLLDGVSDPRAVLGELLALRRSWYARAAIRIPMDESSPDAALSELLRHFGEETP